MLYQWSKDWQMTFNIDKCKTMHLGRSNPETRYYMNGQELSVVSTEKDLGVTISDDLKVSVQCRNAYDRANRMLGLIRRTIESRSPSILLNLFKSLVRPHLEYCSPAWSPHYGKDKDLLESVQHRFTRMFKDLRPLVYLNRLNKLNLWTLEERRNRADLLEVFKMFNGLSDIPLSAFFELKPAWNTRGHNRRLAKRNCRRDSRLHFFSVRVVNRWNALPGDVVESQSLNVFKNSLNRLRSQKMGFFMDSWSA